MNITQVRNVKVLTFILGNSTSTETIKDTDCMSLRTIISLTVAQLKRNV